MAMTEKALSTSAKLAWDCYLKMSETKQTYYNFMQSLETKYKESGAPSNAENQQLQHMLQAHSARVDQFNQAMQAISSPQDRALLIEKMR